MKATAQCIIDGHHGVYIPQMFAEQYGHMLPASLQDDIKLLTDGPSEWYWETWEAVLDAAVLTIDGQEYYLYKDNDLFIIPVGMDADDCFQ